MRCTNCVPLKAQEGSEAPTMDMEKDVTDVVGVKFITYNCSDCGRTLMERIGTDSDIPY